MTAEQALIEENKKDPRVRYITYNPKFKSLTFWENKPEYDEYERHFWSSSYRSHIENFNSICTEKFIICIDDILPKEEFTENWYIECTKNNIDILDGWRLKNAKEHLGWVLRIGHIVLSKNLNDNSLFHINYDGCFPSEDYINYQKITLKQFKKYVLKEKVQEEKEQKVTLKVNDEIIKTETVKKQEKVYTSNDMADSFKYSIANHPIMSIAENETEESQKEQEGIRTEKVLYPRRLWIEDRINAINQSVKSYLDYDYCIPPEWVNERNELIEQLKNL